MRLSATILSFVLVLGVFVLVSAADRTSRSADNGVERAARQYRIQVYDTFRTDRAEYDLRREQGDTILGQWEAAGRPEEAEALLTDWFASAKQACRSAEGAMPEMPDLTLFAGAGPAVSDSPSAPARDEAGDRERVEASSPASSTVARPSADSQPADSQPADSQPAEPRSAVPQAVDSQAAEAHGAVSDTPPRADGSRTWARPNLGSVGSALWRAITE